MAPNTVMNKLLLIGFNNGMKQMTDKLLEKASINLGNFTTFVFKAPHYLMHPLRTLTTTEKRCGKRARDEDTSSVATSDVNDQTALSINKRTKTTHIEDVENIINSNESSTNSNNDSCNESDLEASQKLATPNIVFPIFRSNCFIGLDDYLKREKTLNIETAAHQSILCIDGDGHDQRSDIKTTLNVPEKNRSAKRRRGENQSMGSNKKKKTTQVEDNTFLCNMESTDDLLNMNMDKIIHKEEHMRSWNAVFGNSYQLLITNLE